VKLPGPVVTAIRSISSNSLCASSISTAIIGIRASAWPRTIGSLRCASTPRVESNTQTEQASSAVSMARTRIRSV
jgi:hypothetical protein